MILYHNIKKPKIYKLWSKPPEEEQDISKELTIIATRLSKAFNNDASAGCFPNFRIHYGGSIFITKQTAN